MTTTDALIIIATEIPVILKRSGLIEGISLSQYNVQNSDEIFFWEDIVPSEIASQKETYVVFDVISVKPARHADDKVFSRDAFVGINIYSRKDRNDRVITNLIQKLNNEFLKDKWDFELIDSDYNMAQKIIQLSFHVSKEIK